MKIGGIPKFDGKGLGQVGRTIANYLKLQDRCRRQRIVSESGSQSEDAEVLPENEIERSAPPREKVTVVGCVEGLAAYPQGAHLPGSPTGDRWDPARFRADGQQVSPEDDLLVG